jgi:predicted ATPase
MSIDHGFTFWLAVATSRYNWAVAEEGGSGWALAQMRESLSALRATGTQLDRPYWSCLLAETFANTNHLDEGLVALKEALAAADGSEDRHYQAEVYRVEGELLLRQNELNFTEVQCCFERAIEIAREQSAKSWELRATTSLARLLDNRGRREEARAMLADIYNWFTEGFDTADLKDAKVLLDQLNN